MRILKNNNNNNIKTNQTKLIKINLKKNIYRGY